MPVDFFGAPTGPAAPKYDNLIAGSPEYTSAIVDQTAGNLRPYFQQAQRAQRQGQIGGGGETPEGVAQQGDLSLKEAYLGKLGDTSRMAAMKGADVGEENRRRQQSRDWLVQDRDYNAAILRDRENREEERANQAMWGNIISTAAGAAGSYFGGPVGGMAASAGAKKLWDSQGNPTSYPEDDNLMPPPGYDDPYGPPPQ